MATTDNVSVTLQQQIEEEWRLHWIDYMVKYDKLKYNSQDERLTFELALKHKKYVSWVDFSSNKNVKIQHVVENLDLPWNWSSLSRNSSITLLNIESHLDKPWNWNAIVYNHNLTCDFIEKHIDRNWNWGVLHYCIGMTGDFIEKHMDKPWNFCDLSIRIDIPFYVIEKHMDKNWDFSSLSLRRDLPLSFVEKYPEKNWNINVMFCHPDITFDYVQNSKFFKRVSERENGHPIHMRMNSCISFKHYESRWIAKRILSTLLIYLHEFYNNPSTYDNPNDVFAITNIERILHDTHIAKTILCYV